MTSAEHDGLPPATRSRREEIACPWCGRVCPDLWDYRWTALVQEKTMMCLHCDRAFMLSRVARVTYTATPLVPKEQP